MLRNSVLTKWALGLTLCFSSVAASAALTVSGHCAANYYIHVYPVPPSTEPLSDFGAASCTSLPTDEPLAGLGYYRSADLRYARASLGVSSDYGHLSASTTASGNNSIVYITGAFSAGARTSSDAGATFDDRLRVVGSAAVGSSATLRVTGHVTSRGGIGSYLGASASSALAGLSFLDATGTSVMSELSLFASPYGGLLRIDGGNEWTHYGGGGSFGLDQDFSYDVTVPVGVDFKISAHVSSSAQGSVFGGSSSVAMSAFVSVLDSGASLYSVSGHDYGPISPVPEPTTFGLVLLGLLATAWRARGRRDQAAPLF